MTEQSNEKIKSDHFRNLDSPNMPTLLPGY